uniref:Tyrosine-protein kinase Fps85D n=1 Tax=Schistocephalus solidus TaxID=70667 RepID=A0A0X3PNG5_SCHSO
MCSLPWYHGFLPRALAEKRLIKDGSFLVYNTFESPDSILLCIKWNGQCHHVPIQSPKSATQPGDTSSYSLGGPLFSSLNELISYYKDNQLPIDLKSGAILFTPVLSPPEPTAPEGSSDCGIQSLSITKGLRLSDSDLSITRCSPCGTHSIQCSKDLCRRPAIRAFNEVRSLHNLADFSHTPLPKVDGFRRRELSGNCISNDVDNNLNSDPIVVPPRCSALQNGELKRQEVGKPKLDRKQIRYLFMNEQPPQISSDSPSSPSRLRCSNIYNLAYADVPSDTGSLANSNFLYVQPLTSGVNSASLQNLTFLTDVYADPSLFNFDNTSKTYVPVPFEPPRKPFQSPSSEAFARNSNKPPLPSSSRPQSTITLQLDVLCQGFINYDLTCAEILPSHFELPCDDNVKPLNSTMWQSIGAFLLSEVQPSNLARALALEYVHLLMLRWATASSTPTSSGPSDGFSLILWPAANGYREDLFNRDRFLSLFVVASVVLQPQLERRAQILLLWLRTIHCLLSEYKDNLSSNGLLNGIFSSQVSLLRQTWRSLCSMGNTEITQESLNDLRSQMVSVERCPLSTRAIEIYASCFSTTSVCIPNLVPLVSLLCRAARARLTSTDRQRSLSGSLSSLFEGSANQHQEKQSAPGVTPVPSPGLIAYLDTARRVFRTTNIRRSSSSSSCASPATPQTSLWIEKLEKSQSEVPPSNLRKFVCSENLLLSLIGPVLINRESQMDLFHTKLNYALTCLAERLEAQ